MTPFAPCFVENEFYYYKLWTQFQGIYYSLPEHIGLFVWIVSFLILLCRVLVKLWHTGNVEEVMMIYVCDWKQKIKLGGRNFVCKLHQVELG